MSILSIYFGTTKSYIGINTNTGIEVITNQTKTTSMPSAIYIDNQQIKVGYDAIKYSKRYPKKFIFDINMMLGRKYSDKLIQNQKRNWPFEVEEDENGWIKVKIGNNSFKPYILAGYIIAFLAKIANKRLENQSSNVVITVPIYFNYNQRNDLEMAVKSANLNLVGFIEEPISSALFYGFINPEFTQKRVLIYNLTDASFDISCITVNQSQIELINYWPNLNLGKKEFIKKLLDFVLQSFSNELETDLSKEPKIVNDLNFKCQKAIDNFSTLDSITIKLTTQNKKLILRISRGMFEELCDDLFFQCTKMFCIALDWCKESKYNIDDVILSGDSSFFQKFYRMVKEVTQKNPYPAPNLHEFIIRGACIYGASLKLKNSSSKNFLTFSNNKNDIFINDNSNFLSNIKFYRKTPIEIDVKINKNHNKFQKDEIPFKFQKDEIPFEFQKVCRQFKNESNTLIQINQEQTKLPDKCINKKFGIYAKVLLNGNLIIVFKNEYDGYFNEYPSYFSKSSSIEYVNVNDNVVSNIMQKIKDKSNKHNLKIIDEQENIDETKHDVIVQQNVENNDENSETGPTKYQNDNESNIVIVQQNVENNDEIESQNETAQNSKATNSVTQDELETKENNFDNELFKTYVREYLNDCHYIQYYYNACIKTQQIHYQKLSTPDKKNKINGIYIYLKGKYSEITEFSPSYANNRQSYMNELTNYITNNFSPILSKYEEYNQ